MILGILIISVIVLIIIIIAIFKKANLKIKSKFGEINLNDNEIKIKKINDDLFCVSQLKIDQIAEDIIRANDNIHFLRKQIIEKQMIIVERNKDIIIYKIMNIVKNEFELNETEEKYKLLKLFINTGMVEFINTMRVILKENHLYKYDNINEWEKYKDFVNSYVFSKVQSKINDISFSFDMLSRSEFIKKCGEKINELNDTHIKTLLEECKEISTDIHIDILKDAEKQNNIKILKGE